MQTATRPCFSFNQQGYLTGMSVAYPDQQNPGEWLLPAFATFLAPPSAHDKIAKWTGNTWLLADLPQEAVAHDGPPPEVIAARARNARIEDARAAAAATIRMRDDAVAAGQTVLTPWLDYIDALIAVGNTPAGKDPDPIPERPATPLFDPPPPEPAQE
jgi:hypothetical protein